MRDLLLIKYLSYSHNAVDTENPEDNPTRIVGGNFFSRE